MAWLATTVDLFVTAMTGGRLVAAVGVRRLLLIGLSLSPPGRSG